MPGCPPVAEVNCSTLEQLCLCSTDLTGSTGADAVRCAEMSRLRELDLTYSETQSRFFNTILKPCTSMWRLAVSFEMVEEAMAFYRREQAEVDEEMLEEARRKNLRVRYAQIRTRCQKRQEGLCLRGRWCLFAHAPEEQGMWMQDYKHLAEALCRKSR